VADDRIDDRLRNEVERLRDAAMRSTDPLVVAKAIAASDPVVLKAVSDRLARGERLVETAAFGGPSRTDVQVLFRLESSEGAGLIDRGVLANVDMLRGEVGGVIEDHEMAREHRVERPFAPLFPLDATRNGDSEGERRMRVRERAFFRSVGVSPFTGFGDFVLLSPYTYTDSIIGTATTCGTSGHDDTRSDYVGDYEDEIFF
jgi:hypothetical protein